MYPSLNFPPMVISCITIEQYHSEEMDTCTIYQLHSGLTNFSCIYVCVFNSKSYSHVQVCMTATSQYIEQFQYNDASCYPFTARAVCLLSPSLPGND